MQQVRSTLALVSLLAGSIAIGVTVPAALYSQSASAPAPAAAAFDSLAFPRQVLNWLYLSEADSLWAHSSEAMREQMGTVDHIEEAAIQIAANLGEETEVLGEQLLTRGDRVIYLRGTRHAQMPEPLYWVVIFTPADGQIHALFPAPRATIEEQFPGAELP